MPQQRVEDKSNDRKYYAMLPRLVFYKCTSPYDFALYFSLKDVAGEEGECWIGTPDLAKIAMMSSGQVCKSRKVLMEVGLIEGEIRRDPDAQQPTWHIRIVDVWQENLIWCKEHPKKKDWLGQREKQLSQGESLPEGKDKIGQPGELSPSEKGTTPSEKGITPDEKGTTSGETKNNLKEEPKEEPKAKIGASALSPAEIHRQRTLEALITSPYKKGSGDDFSRFPEDCRGVIQEFCKLWQIPLPRYSKSAGGPFAQWINGGRDLMAACGGYGMEALKKAHEKFIQRPFDVGHPGAVVKLVGAAAGELARSKPKKPVPTRAEFSQYVLDVGDPDIEDTDHDFRLWLKQQGVQTA